MQCPLRDATEPSASRGITMTTPPRLTSQTFNAVMSPMAVRWEKTVPHIYRGSCISPPQRPMPPCEICSQDVTSKWPEPLAPLSTTATKMETLSNAANALQALEKGERLKYSAGKLLGLLRKKEKSKKFLPTFDSGVIQVSEESKKTTWPGPLDSKPYVESGSGARAGSGRRIRSSKAILRSIRRTALNGGMATKGRKQSFLTMPTSPTRNGPDDSSRSGPTSTHSSQTTKEEVSTSDLSASWSQASTLSSRSSWTSKPEKP